MVSTQKKKPLMAWRTSLVADFVLFWIDVDDDDDDGVDSIDSLVSE